MEHRFSFFIILMHSLAVVYVLLVFYDSNRQARLNFSQSWRRRRWWKWFFYISLRHINMWEGATCNSTLIECDIYFSFPACSVNKFLAVHALILVYRDASNGFHRNTFTCFWRSDSGDEQHIAQFRLLLDPFISRMLAWGFNMTSSCAALQSNALIWIYKEALARDEICFL